VNELKIESTASLLEPKIEYENEDAFEYDSGTRTIGEGRERLLKGQQTANGEGLSGDDRTQTPNAER
jgi:hypothetical protein